MPQAADVLDLATPSGCATLADFIGSPRWAERDALLRGAKAVAAGL